jgi:hypothetical protein
MIKKNEGDPQIAYAELYVYSARPTALLRSHTQTQEGVLDVCIDDEFHETVVESLRVVPCSIRW